MLVVQLLVLLDYLGQKAKIRQGAMAGGIAGGGLGGMAGLGAGYGLGRAMFAKDEEDEDEEKS